MNPMAYNKSHDLRTGSTETGYAESILDILDEEMAEARKNPEIQEPSDEMDSLVSDLLGYLNVNPVED